MKLWDKIGRIILNILIVIITIIAVFNVYCFITLTVLNKDYVSVFGYTYFEVASGSMEPEIGVHDIVILKLNSDYKVNDIVTYISDEDFVTHRIIGINNKMIVTKGDANNTKDNPITYKEIIGKVVYVVDNGGVWKEVFLTPKVIILLIITLILFSFTFSYNSKKKRDRIKEKKKNKELVTKNTGDNNVQ